jgi:hypothetical protein
VDLRVPVHEQTVRRHLAYHLRVLKPPSKPVNTEQPPNLEPQ